MVESQQAQKHLNILEDTLVKQFRLCQLLQNMTKEERIALMNYDVKGLPALVEHKEALLDELGQLEEGRRMATQELNLALGLGKESPTVADVIAAVDSETASRLKHLYEGIMTLMDEVRDLTQGNRAVAETALERTDAVQAFLLSLIEPPTGYRPPTIKSSQSPSVALEIDQAA